MLGELGGQAAQIISWEFYVLKASCSYSLLFSLQHHLEATHLEAKVKTPDFLPCLSSLLQPQCNKDIYLATQLMHAVPEQAQVSPFCLP